MWVPKSVKDPILLHHPTRKSIACFGAVRISDGKLVTMRTEDSFNAQTVWEFLKLLRQETKQAGRKVVVIIDNAKQHHAIAHKAWRQEQAPDFVLEYLPPYSPQLNPIERVWKAIRAIRLHNRYFPTLAVLTKAVDEQFMEWAKPNETLRRLCAIT
jgi:transposase